MNFYAPRYRVNIPRCVPATVYAPQTPIFFNGYNTEEEDACTMEDDDWFRDVEMERRRTEQRKKEYKRQREYLLKQAEKKQLARQMLLKEQQELEQARIEAEAARQEYIREKELLLKQQREFQLGGVDQVSTGQQPSVSAEASSAQNSEQALNAEGSHEKEETAADPPADQSKQREAVQIIEGWWKNCLGTRQDQEALKQLKNLRDLQSKLDKMCSRVRQLTFYSTSDANGNQLVFTFDNPAKPTLIAGPSANKPYIEAEEQLLRLLTQLDSILSYGSDEVRKSRKQLVEKAQEMLEQLDAYKQEQFERQSSQCSSDASDTELACEKAKDAPEVANDTEPSSMDVCHEQVPQALPSPAPSECSSCTCANSPNFKKRSSTRQRSRRYKQRHTEPQKDERPSQRVRELAPPSNDYRNSLVDLLSLLSASGNAYYVPRGQQIFSGIL